MSPFNLFFIEIFLITFIIIFLHRIKNIVGLGIMFIFVGAIQFFQTVLAASVYNEIAPSVVVSPGSAILFCSTLSIILLVFHTEGAKKTRTLIFGVTFSNVIMALLSIITLYQLNYNKNTIDTTFLKEIFHFDITLFLTGTIAMFVDFFLIVICFQTLNYFLPKLPFIIRFYVPFALVALFDSMIYYNLVFINMDYKIDLLFSNIIGKQISVFVLSILIWLYLYLSKQKKTKELPKTSSAILTIFSYYEETPQTK